MNQVIAYLCQNSQIASKVAILISMTVTLHAISWFTGSMPQRTTSRICLWRWCCKSCFKTQAGLRKRSNFVCHSYELSFHEVNVIVKLSLDVLEWDVRVVNLPTVCKPLHKRQALGYSLANAFLLRDELFISVCLLLVQSSGTLSFHTSLSCS